MTTNFNIEKTLEETNNNCPDFQFVEYDFLALRTWQEEYEKANPVFGMKGQTLEHHHDLGDEKINEIIFDFLKPIIIKFREKSKFIFLLQMLDSGCVGVI